MSIEIEPLELGFRRPLTVEVSQTLRIKNSTPTPVAFKVKTTAPKQYCVRPNSGRVEPGSAVEVQVLLQAMRQDPPMDYRCKDKFLVQTVPITADREFSNIATLWQQLDGDKSAIQEKKIRVQFLPPESHDTLPIATPTRPIGRNSLAATDTPAHTYSSPGDESHIADETALPEQPSSPEQSEESRHSVQAVSNNEKPSYEELASKLKDAEARLQDDVRQRTGVGANEKTPNTTMQQPQGNQGVPLNIAAALCLLAFLLAYFFF